MYRIRASFAALALSCALLSPVQAADAPSEPGVRIPTAAGIAETSAQLMQRQAVTPPRRGERPEHELEGPDRSQLKANPDALLTSRFPLGSPSAADHPRSIHTPSTSFDGATLTDTGAFPPDSMGTVGPTQYVVAVNGRIRSFTKAGVADGVLNLDPDVFFASVMTPVVTPVVLNFTSDPQVRYDRFSGRWFLSIIDVPCTNAGCTATAANRWLLAVSDAASGGTISGSTVWTFFFVTTDPGSNFCDYPSLGIDVNALYFGCNMFSSAGAFVGTNGYVVRKSSVLGAGPAVVTSFPNLAVGTGAGPYTPRGVDNFDPAATEGYFVGVDNAAFSTLVFRRVSNPGGTPTISANISVTVPTTVYPSPVEHAGNTGGTNGRLDSLDDRLFAAMIRNGRLWTAHNLRVSTTGVASTTATSRKAARWYELQNLTTTPTLVQSGTVYDNAATLAAALQYWIPSVTVTGQGHAVIGFSQAGTPLGATPAYAGRLAGDTLGTMAGPPTVAAVQYGITSANYNPPSDPGGAAGRRWGDYSFTVVDPLDDMTIWTIQEYNQVANNYAVRVGKLLAPPPATPTCSGSPIPFTAGTGNVVIGATSSGGSGFYDPGANLPAPALPFSHLTASVTNATVNTVTYNSPTQATLNITAAVAGLQNVTITNPDGQSVTANNCINVTVPSFTLTYTAGANGTISGTSPQTVSSGGSGTSVTAVPNGGYHFVQWSDGSTANPRTDTNVTANISVTASFAINTYTLTYTAGANGTITGTSPQTVNHGSNGTAVTATPNAGYHFVQWSDGSTANPRTDTNVTANITVSASFAINTYTLTYTAGANGTITGTSPQTVNHGANGTAVTATPNVGYHFVQWSDGSTANPRTDTNVTANITVSASFAINTYTLTYTAGANGTITGTSPQTVNHGANGTAVTATPDPGYVFVQWSDGSTANPRTDTNVTANISVTASFAINTYTLTYTAGANGTISGISPQTVSSGGSGAPVSAVPNAGYHFVQWSDGSTANPRTDTNVTANITVSASFAINTYTLTYTAGANGTITGTSPQTVNHGANGTPVTATANAGYHFVQWSDGSIANPRTDTNVTANITVSASFAINTYTLTYTAGANGTITGTSPQTVNHGANGTPVTATPSAGYHFVQWSDGSIANPRTDTNVTANITVSASFAINTYTLTYTAGANGTIVGTSPQTVNHGANGTPVTATPNAGYHFVQWSDGSTANPRTDTNVTANITVSASFAINTYTLTYTAGANGTIVGTSPQTVNHGANGTPVTATPNAGYHFVQWSDGSTANPRTETNVTANITVSASFAINTYTLTYTAGANGTIVGTSPQTVNSGASGTPVTATPNAAYHFVQWSDGSTANPRTDTNVTANISVTASFAINTYTLTYTAGANGTIVGTSPQTVNSGASGAPVTATPNVGYHFVQWSDASTANPRTDTNVTANISVTASFAIDTFTVSATSGGNGTITPASQTVNSSGVANFTVTPALGYHVANVTGDTCTVTHGSGFSWSSSAITANCAVLATFAIDTFTVTASAGANGTITPATQTVNYNSSASFTVTAASAYHVVLPVGGSCPAGTLTGSTYSTGPITGNCNVAVVFAPNPPDHLMFVQPPTDVPQGDRLGAIQVAIVDAQGNTITTDSTSQISVATLACGGSVALEQATVVNGVATFPANTTKRFYTLASGKTLSATSGSLTGTSPTFGVVVSSGFLFADGLETCRL